jgi:hypothetical protein
MKVTFENTNRVDIDMGDGKSLIILAYNDGSVSISSHGPGQRMVQEVQNRQDGHSSVTLTPQK